MLNTVAAVVVLGLLTLAQVMYRWGYNRGSYWAQRHVVDYLDVIDSNPNWTRMPHVSAEHFELDLQTIRAILTTIETLERRYNPPRLLVWPNQEARH